MINANHLFVLLLTIPVLKLHVLLQIAVFRLNNRVRLESSVAIVIMNISDLAELFTGKKV